MISPGRRSNSTRGGALVEFSLMIFLLIMVILVTVEIDRMFLVYTTVCNAARAGARYAVVHGGLRTGSGVNGQSGPGNTTQVETVVKNFASVGLLDTGKLNIAVSYPQGNLPGSAVVVTVTYPYDPFVSWFTQLAVNLGSTTRGVISY